MDKRLIHTDGTYRVWKAGLKSYVVTANGVEIGRGKSLDRALRNIATHRQDKKEMQLVEQRFPYKPEPLHPDTEAWLNEQIGSQ